MLVGLALTSSFSVFSNQVLAANVVYVNGRVTTQVLGCFNPKPYSNVTVVIKRNTAPAIAITTKTNASGYYGVSFDNKSGGTFSVYLPNSVTTELVYTNINPCKGVNEYCSYTVNLREIGACY